MFISKRIERSLHDNIAQHFATRNANDNKSDDSATIFWILQHYK